MFEGLDVKKNGQLEGLELTNFALLFTFAYGDPETLEKVKAMPFKEFEKITTPATLKGVDTNKDKKISLAEWNATLDKGGFKKLANAGKL